MKKYLLFLIALMFITPAFAEMTGGNYAIPLLTISSGGHASMEGGSYRLHDLKGQGVIGVSSGGNYNAQLGGIYGIGGGGGVGIGISIDGAPVGTVPLRIARDGGDVKITWEASIHNPQFFVLSGDGSGVYANSEGWVPIANYSDPGEFDDLSAAPGLSDGILFHQGQIGGGAAEVYYKALQPGVIPADSNPDTGASNLASAWAVGKVNVDLPLNTFKLINIPFVLGAINVKDVIGDQLSAAKLQYNENGLKQIVLRGGSWDGEINLQNATGYWLKSTDRDAVCTFYGAVVKQKFTKRVPQGWDLYGYPLPKKVGAVTLGISPVIRDKLRRLQSGALVQLYYNGSAWDDPTFQIEGREGFWYGNPQAAPERYLDVTP